MACGERRKKKIAINYTDIRITLTVKVVINRSPWAVCSTLCIILGHVSKMYSESKVEIFFLYWSYPKHDRMSEELILCIKFSAFMFTAHRSHAFTLSVVVVVSLYFGFIPLVAIFAFMNF